MTVLRIFLESSLKKHYKIWYRSSRKVVSKLKLPETQFERTVRDKIACKTCLESENDGFKYIFGILIKFPIQ